MKIGNLLLLIFLLRATGNANGKLPKKSDFKSRLTYSVRVKGVPSCSSGCRKPIGSTLSQASLCKRLPSGTFLPNYISRLSYIVCIRGTAFQVDCPSGFHYDHQSLTCVSASLNAANCEKSIEAISTAPVSTLNQASVCRGLPTGTFLPDSRSRLSYIICAKGEAIYVNCPSGSYYDHQSFTCVPASLNYVDLNKLIEAISTAPVSTLNQASVCRGLPTGTFLPDSRSRLSYIICTRGEAIYVNCPRGFYYDETSFMCVSASSNYVEPLAATTTAPCTTPKATTVSTPTTTTPKPTTTSAPCTTPKATTVSTPTTTTPKPTTTSALCTTPKATTVSTPTTTTPKPTTTSAPCTTPKPTTVSTPTTSTPKPTTTSAPCTTPKPTTASTPTTTTPKPTTVSTPTTTTPKPTTNSAPCTTPKPTTVSTPTTTTSAPCSTPKPTTVSTPTTTTSAPCTTPKPTTVSTPTTTTPKPTTGSTPTTTTSAPCTTPKPTTVSTPTTTTPKPTTVSTPTTTTSAPCTTPKPTTVSTPTTTTPKPTTTSAPCTTTKPTTTSVPCTTSKSTAACTSSTPQCNETPSPCDCANETPEKTVAGFKRNRLTDCNGMDANTIFLDRYHCARYYECNSRGVLERRNCPKGQWFDHELLICRNKQDVNNCLARRQRD